MSDEREEALRLAKEAGFSEFPEPGTLEYEHVDQIIELIRLARQSAPCPHIRSSDEGTQYCELAQSAPQQEPVAWIADIAGYADHKKVRYIVFDKSELTCIKDGKTVWTPVYASPPAQPDVVRDALRYRWLRLQKHADIAAQWFLPSEAPFCAPSTPSEIDSAIDAAMQPAPGTEGKL